MCRMIASPLPSVSGQPAQTHPFGSCAVPARERLLVGLVLKFFEGSRLFYRRCPMKLLTIPTGPPRASWGSVIAGRAAPLCRPQLRKSRGTVEDLPSYPYILPAPVRQSNRFLKEQEMTAEEKRLSTAESRPPVTEEQIRALAYDLWERDGSPDGQSEEYWDRARQQLLGDGAPPQPSSGSSTG
jgi:hypothetical protein